MMLVTALLLLCFDPPAPPDAPSRFPLDFKLRDNEIVISLSEELNPECADNIERFYEYFRAPEKRQEIARSIRSYLGDAATKRGFNDTDWLPVEKRLRRLKNDFKDERDIKVFQNALARWEKESEFDWEESYADMDDWPDKFVLRAEDIAELARAEANESRRRTRTSQRDGPPAPVIAIGVIVLAYIVVKGMTKRLG